jgi:hypothetical protein
VLRSVYQQSNINKGIVKRIVCARTDLNRTLGRCRRLFGAW